jgi:hypothetical protein
LAERSATAALDRLQKLAEAGERLAVVMADQCLPDMTGIEMLAKVRDIDWRVKCALMVEVGGIASPAAPLTGHCWWPDRHLSRPALGTSSTAAAPPTWTGWIPAKATFVTEPAFVSRGR